MPYLASEPPESTSIPSTLRELAELPNDSSSRRQPTSIRLTQDERSLLDELTARLQDDAPPGVTITQTATIVRALYELRAHLDKLERDRKRKR